VNSRRERVFDEHRSLLFKKLQVVRFFDAERNVLVYVAYSDRVIEGSPKNSISTVPIMDGRHHKFELRSLNRVLKRNLSLPSDT